MQITINTPGAKTLADARPMIVDGQRVYVTVGGGVASLHIGGRIVAEQSADDMTTRAAQDWAVAYLDAANDWADQQAAAAQDHMVADEAAVAEATDQDAVYAGQVQTIRDAGDLLAKEADKLAAKAQPGRYRFVNSMGKVRFLNDSDPRHPLNAAPTLRAQAARLSAWTVQDEVAYLRYQDDSISGSDGYVAPLSRIGWGMTLGAR